MRTVLILGSFLLLGGCPEKSPNRIYINGIVVDGIGNPIDGATVESGSLDICPGNSPPATYSAGVYTWTTDSSGQWSDSFLVYCKSTDGNCEFRISKAGYTPTTKIVNYDCNGDTVNVNVTLTP